MFNNMSSSGDIRKKEKGTNSPILLYLPSLTQTNETNDESDKKKSELLSCPSITPREGPFTSPASTEPNFSTISSDTSVVP